MSYESSDIDDIGAGVTKGIVDSGILNYLERIEKLLQEIIKTLVFK